MARPRKCRTVCDLPDNSSFGPLDRNHDTSEVILMTVEEFETIRLIDIEHLTQQECSVQMQVSRATVQGTYDGARSKLADCLVNGKRLQIEGGDYQLCRGHRQGCHRTSCPGSKA